MVSDFAGTWNAVTSEDNIVYVIILYDVYNNNYKCVVSEQARRTLARPIHRKPSPPSLTKTKRKHRNIIIMF